MALLGDPYVGVVVSEQLKPEDLIQSLRSDIAGELEAIIHYDAHAQACSDERVKQILLHIRDEERQHVGSLMTALSLLDPQEAQYFQKGQQMVDQIVSGQAVGGQAQGAENQPYQASNMGQHTYQSPQQFDQNQ